MAFWSKIFGRKESLVLSYDVLSDEEERRFEEQVTEVGKFYRFQKISDIVAALEKKEPLGSAALVIRRARKRFFLGAAAFLQDRNIPFILCLNSDCVGTNRLPPEEEIALFQQAYPEGFTAFFVQEVVDLGWDNPEKLDAFLGECRQRLGPFPVEKGNPTHYFATWGQIATLPPHLVEYGMELTASPFCEREEKGLRFLARQVQGPLQTVYSPREIGGEGEKRLADLGIRNLITPTEGMVTPASTKQFLWKLPVWPLPEKETHEEEENEK